MDRPLCAVTRRPVRLWLLLAVAFLLLAGLAIASVAGFAPGDREPQRLRGSAPPPGVKLPDFALENYTGERVQRGDLTGNVVVITFLETKCREACPLIAAHIARAAGLLPSEVRRRTRFLAISTHPTDDTPASVRRFLARHHARGTLDYLIGTESDLRPVWNEFAVFSALDSGDANSHSASVRIFDSTGTWVSSLRTGVDLTAANLSHDIRTVFQG